MIDPRSQDLICKAADGEATSSELHELEAMTRDDPTLALVLAESKKMNLLLSGVQPIDPPENFLDLVLKKVRQSPRYGVEREANQLFPSSTVIGSSSSESTTRIQLFVFRNTTLQIILSKVETTMSEIQKSFISGTFGKILVGGGVAAAALIAVTSGIDFPSSSQDTAGTISPAVRYRSDQGVTANVQAGPSGTQQTAQVPSADGAAARSASNSADKSAQASAEKSAQASAEKSAQASAERSAQASAEKSAQAAAEKSAQKSAEKSAQASAEKSAQASAEKSAQASAEKAAQASAEKAAQKSAEKSAQASAEKSAQASAEKAAQASAEKAAQKSAEKSAQASAEKAAQKAAQKMAN